MAMHAVSSLARRPDDVLVARLRPRRGAGAPRAGPALARPAMSVSEIFGPRRQLALALGARLAPLPSGLTTASAAATAPRFSLVVDTAGYPQSLSDACTRAANGGTVLVVALSFDAVMVVPAELVERTLTISGSVGFDDELEEALSVLASEPGPLPAADNRGRAAGGSGRTAGGSPGVNHRPGRWWCARGRSSGTCRSTGARTCPSIGLGGPALVPRPESFPPTRPRSARRPTSRPPSPSSLGRVNRYPEPAQAVDALAPYAGTSPDRLILPTAATSCATSWPRCSLAPGASPSSATPATRSTPPPLWSRAPP